MADDEQVTTPVDERDSVDHSEFTSDSNECPQCGEPVDNLRKTCLKCGYEYGEDDYDDTEAGNEFRGGAALDDDGNEITDEEALDEETSQDQSANDGEAASAEHR